MDDKLKLKTVYDLKLEEGRENFNDYCQNNKIDEWVDIYMPFMDPDTKKCIVKCYTEIYNATRK